MRGTLRRTAAARGRGVKLVAAAAMAAAALPRAGWCQDAGAPGSEAGAGPAVGAATSFTAGSRGYKRWSASMDGSWRGRVVDPYGWAGLTLDSDQRRLSLGGGVWRDLREDLRVKGGAGLAVSRLRDEDGSGSSLLLETGVERDHEAATWGGEYRYCAGSAGGSGRPRPGEGRLPRARRGAAPAPDRERFVYHELAAYARAWAGKARASLAFAVGLPSDADTVTSETVGLRVAVTDPLSVSGAVAFEQGPRSGAYVTLGLEYLF